MSMRLDELALMPTGVDWEIWPDTQGPVPWSFDSDAGVVQGPLELSGFRGRTLLITLAPGQVGLLTVAGELRAVLLGGRHCLHIASADEPSRRGASDGDSAGMYHDTCPPSTRLMAIDTERPLRVRWGDHTPLRCVDCPARPTDAASDQAGRPGGRPAGPHGDCEILIHNPVSFYHAFLRRTETVGEPFLCSLIGTLVQSRLDDLLADPGTAGAGWRDRLASVTPQQLERELDTYGITCLAFACDRPAVEERPRAPLASGQRPSVRDTEEVLVS